MNYSRVRMNVALTPLGKLLRRRPPTINAGSMGLAGDYKFTVLDGATRQVKHQTDWMHNLITDIGLDRFGTGSALGGFCRIGTGTTAPANADTQLVSQSASTSTLVGLTAKANAGSPNYETTATVVFEFALGAVVGNMAEVGIGWASTGATLFSRARIVDGGGSPTTITVLVTEILQVTYRLTVFPQITDSTGTVVISGITYNYTSRASSVSAVAGALEPNGAPLSSAAFPGAHPGAIGAITGIPSGVVAAMSAGALGSYTNGTYYREYTITASITQGNAVGGILSINGYVGNGLGALMQTQTQYSPVIPKDGTKTFSLVMRVSWARH